MRAVPESRSELDRILVVVSRPADQRLLASHLGEDHTVLTTPDEVDWATIDLCIVDGSVYGQLEPALARRKEEAEPVYFPVVLLVRDGETINRRISGDGVEAPIDDVIDLPTSKPVLSARIRSLLHARALSLALNDEREQFRAFARSVSDAVVITDDRGIIVFANRALTDIVGTSVAVAEGRSIETILPSPIDPAAGGPVERRLRHRSGREIPVEVTVSVFESAGDQLAAYVIRDITERIDRQRELKRAAALLEESTDLNAILDPDGTIQYVTPSVSTVLGFTQDALQGTNAFDKVHPADLETALSAFGQTLEDPNARPTAVFRFAHADGSWVVLEATGRNLLDDPQVGGIVVYTRDVTDREARERALERYRSIVEAAPDPVYALDANGRFTLVNEAVVELSGYDRADLLGEHVSHILGSDDIDRAETLLGDLLDMDTDMASMELSIQTADGSLRRYEVNVSVMTDAGEFAGSVGVARDITELREHERRLSVLDRVLRHNLRNKMNVVLGNASDIETRCTAQLRDHAKAIRSVSEELLALSAAVRDFHQAIDPQSADIDIEDLVAHVESVVEETRQSHPHTTISLDAPEIARARLPSTLDLALAELLENAVIHNDRDAPSIDVTVAAGDATVVVQIADDGPGLNQTEREALLRGVEGPLEHMSGLGLWLVRWTVENAGGTLDVRENDPRGTLVELRFLSAAEQRPQVGA